MNSRTFLWLIRTRPAFMGTIGLCTTKIGPQVKRIENEIPLWQVNSALSQSCSFSTFIHRCREQEEQIVIDDEKENIISSDVIKKVNEQIKNKSHGRLYSVIYVGGSQYVITVNDLLALKYIPQTSIGDKIRFEKVLCVGGSDFTLYGRPLLPKDLVRIHATVVEKSLLATRVRYKEFKKSKHFVRDDYTVFRITDISVQHPIDGLPDVQGVEGRIL